MYIDHSSNTYEYGNGVFASILSPLHGQQPFRVSSLTKPIHCSVSNSPKWDLIRTRDDIKIFSVRLSRDIRSVQSRITADFFARGNNVDDVDFRAPGRSGFVYPLSFATREKLRAPAFSASRIAAVPVVRLFKQKNMPPRQKNIPSGCEQTAIISGSSIKKSVSAKVRVLYAQNAQECAYIDMHGAHRGIIDRKCGAVERFLLMKRA